MSKARSASMALATPDPSLFDVRQAPIARAASRGSDRRVHARLTPVELQNPITARLKYGERVTQEMETSDGQPVAFPIVRVYSPKPEEPDAA